MVNVQVKYDSENDDYYLELSPKQIKELGLEPDEDYLFDVQVDDYGKKTIVVIPIKGKK